MNERQQAHIDYYLQRLKYWQERKPIPTTVRLLAARDADETHPLWSEEEWRLEREQQGGERRETA